MALVLVYRGSLYARLDECVANMMRSLGRYGVASYVDFDFLQMFMWEHFWGLALVPVVYSTTIPNRVEVVNPTMTKNIYRTHTLRRVGVKQWTGKLLATITDNEENFNFRSHAFIPIGIHMVQVEEVSLELVLTPWLLVLQRLYYFLVLLKAEERTREPCAHDVYDDEANLELCPSRSRVRF